MLQMRTHFLEGRKRVGELRECGMLQNGDSLAGGEEEGGAGL